MKTKEQILAKIDVALYDAETIRDNRMANIVLAGILREIAEVLIDIRDLKVKSAAQ